MSGSDGGSRADSASAESIPSTQVRGSPATRFGGAAGMPAERSKDVRAASRRLLTRLRAERLRVVAVLVLAVGGVTLMVLGPRILGRGTDIIFRGLRSDEGIDFR